MTSENIDTALKLYDIRWRELLGTETYNGEKLPKDKLKTLGKHAEESNEAFKILQRLEDEEETRYANDHLKFVYRESFDSAYDKCFEEVELYHCNGCEDSECDTDLCYIETIAQRESELTEGVLVRERKRQLFRTNNATEELWEQTLLDIVHGLSTNGSEWYDEHIEPLFEEYGVEGEYTGHGMTAELVEEDDRHKIWRFRCDERSAPAVRGFIENLAWQFNTGRL